MVTSKYLQNVQDGGSDLEFRLSRPLNSDSRVRGSRAIHLLLCIK
jgi:hypothetical protein